MKKRQDPLLTQHALVKRFRRGIAKSLDSNNAEQASKKKMWMKYLNSHIITNTRPWA